MTDKPNFHRDYLYRFSEDECHPDFHFWASCSLIGALLGRRVWFNHGRFTVNPNLYIVLCGVAGSGKDSARNIVAKLMRELFPDYMLSASIQSREDIASLMASPECLRTYKDKNSPTIYEYRPFYLIISEMAGFFSVDCRKMVEMLVEMFDSDYFSTGFKKDRQSGLGQGVINPHMSMLGCVQPDWFMSNMKIDLFQRGLGRRMIIVFRDKDKLNHDPQFPKDSEPGWLRVKEHIKRLHQDNVQGKVSFDAEAVKWWHAYYYDKDKNKPDDPILSQFQATRHIIMLKLATVLSFADYEFDYKITLFHLRLAEMLLKNLEPDIQRLTGGIGQNPMAGVRQLMLDWVKMNDGMARERRCYSTFWKQCPRGEVDYKEGLASLQKEGLIIEAAIPNGEGQTLNWLFTPEKWADYNKKKPNEV